jgi:phage protein D
MTFYPIVRAPRLQLLVNGTAIPALSAEVNSNNYFHADAYTAKILLTDARVIAAGFGRTFWGADGTGATGNPVDIIVQIDPGLSQSANWTTLIQGHVDNVDWNPQTGELHIDGRDRTADLIEAKTFETFRNQTSSQIATILAARHGLTPQVTATTTPVYRYYSAAHDKITLSDFSRVTTEWDLLTFLAQNENFDAFVSGTTLYFQPSTEPGQNPVTFNLDANNQPWLIANGIDIALKRSLNLARDIQVTVRSWDSKNGVAFTVTAKATGTRKASASTVAKAGSTTTQNYDFQRPNLTHDQAQTLANSKLKLLSAHERMVTVSMPGDVTMQPRQGLQIAGTGTNFDLAYFVTEISRTIDSEGFHQTVTAKSSSPKDTVSVG